MFQLDGTTLSVETKQLNARFEHGVLTTLERKRDGRRFVHTAAGDARPLALRYGADELAALAGNPGDDVVCRRLGEREAEFRFAGYNGDGILSVREDPESGELLLEPSAFASRPGLAACRYWVHGIDPALELVAPFFQGTRFRLDHRHAKATHWTWPHQWEAGMAILTGNDGGFWIHCRDTRYRYKALHIGSESDPFALGLDTESYGPLESNLGAGGLVWRIGVFDGGWQQPADQYRQWWTSAFGPRAPRPDWLDGLRLAVSWCPTDPALLEALAARIAPDKVLLHLPGWRSDPYDENYPTYVASTAGRAFIEKAQAMGFRVMPHCNSNDMDPTHPIYNVVRDFQYRDLYSGRVLGWSWHDGRVLPVPESNAARLRHRDKKTMVKIHPGASIWRSILADNVGSAVSELGLDAVFLDVTLCTWNLHNCLVEDTTSTEGMRLLTARIADLRPKLAVGGEGRNEITALEQSLAQTHLFKSWHVSIDGLAELGRVPLGERMFGAECRSFGYAALSGATANEVARMQMHADQGAIPTLTIRAAAEIEAPNAAVRELLERATS